MFNRRPFITVLLIWLLTVVLTWCGNGQPDVDDGVGVAPAPVVEDTTQDTWDSLDSEDSEEREELEDRENREDDDANDDSQPRVLPDAQWEFDPDAFDDDQIDELLEYIDGLLSEAEEEVSAGTGSSWTAN